MSHMHPTNNHIATASVGLIFAAGLLISSLFISSSSQADQADTQVDITNATTTINNIVISDSSFGAAVTDINLVELTSTTYYVHGEFQDENGCTDVTDDGEFGVALRRSGYDTDCALLISSGSLAPNSQYCYIAASSDAITNGFLGNAFLDSNVQDTCQITNCSGGSDTTANFECAIGVQYYADATDATSSPAYAAENWVAEVLVYDEPFQDIEAIRYASTSAELNTLLAINVSSTNLINYGTLSLGATSSPVQLEIANSGNYNETDLLLSGTDMGCSLVGSIPAGNQRFSSSAGVIYGDMTFSLSSTAANAGVNLAKRKDLGFAFSGSSSNTYWALEVPTAGVLGTCVGTNTIQASL